MQSKQEALLQLLINRQDEQVLLFLHNDPHDLTIHSANFLCEAAENGCVKTVKYLLDWQGVAGDKINPTADDNLSLLSALYYRQARAVEILLNDLRVVDSIGGQAAVVLELVSKVETEFAAYGSQQIIAAAGSNNIGLLNLLMALEEEAPQPSERLNASINHNEALRAAAEAGHIGDGEAVDKLLGSRRVVDSINNKIAEVLQFFVYRQGAEKIEYGARELLTAARDGSAGFMAMLLAWEGENGEELDPTANNNQLLRVAARNGRADVINLLLDNPAVQLSLNAHHEEVRTFLNLQGDAQIQLGNQHIITAATNGHAGWLRFLLAWLSRDVAELDPTTGNYIAIWSAIQRGHTEVATILLNHPMVDEDAQDNRPLRDAVLYGNVELVKLLMTKPLVRLDANNNEAFKSAVLNGNQEIVRLLLASALTVDPTVNDNEAIRIVASEQYRSRRLGSDTDRQNILSQLLEDRRVISSLNEQQGVIGELVKFSGEEQVRYGNEQIIAAVQNQNLGLLKLLLSWQTATGTKLLDSTVVGGQAIDDVQYNALWHAANLGWEDGVKALLLDPRVTPAWNNNAAIMAAIRGNTAGHLAVLMLPEFLSGQNVAMNNHEIFLNVVRSSATIGINFLLAWRGPNGERLNPAINYNAAIKEAASLGHKSIVETLLSDPRVGFSLFCQNKWMWVGFMTGGGFMATVLTVEHLTHSNFIYAPIQVWLHNEPVAITICTVITIVPAVLLGVAAHFASNKGLPAAQSIPVY